eukprot:TRINITY_DN5247_c0_g1_i2.p1 TRINITY_DN5247_c0_g1~~TRINITY_DN5247_c0_g1_i2.p1  ORF type:complete len:2540 (-),score=775.56 TRINITY_DN5247_c0_g1_i2:128-7747(-)
MSKVACSSFVPSKYVKWRCAACGKTDQEHNEDELDEEKSLTKRRLTGNQRVSITGRRSSAGKISTPTRNLAGSHGKTNGSPYDPGIAKVSIKVSDEEADTQTKSTDSVKIKLQSAQVASDLERKQKEQQRLQLLGQAKDTQRKASREEVVKQVIERRKASQRLLMVQKSTGSEEPQPSADSEQSSSPNSKVTTTLEPKRRRVSGEESPNSSNSSDQSTPTNIQRVPGWKLRIMERRSKLKQSSDGESTEQITEEPSSTSSSSPPRRSSSMDSSETSTSTTTPVTTGSSAIKQAMANFVQKRGSSPRIRPKITTTAPNEESSKTESSSDKQSETNHSNDSKKDDHLVVTVSYVPDVLVVQEDVQERLKREEQERIDSIKEAQRREEEERRQRVDEAKKRLIARKMKEQEDEKKRMAEEAEEEARRIQKQKEEEEMERKRKEQEEKEREKEEELKRKLREEEEAEEQKRVEELQEKLQKERELKDQQRDQREKERNQKLAEAKKRREEKEAQKKKQREEEEKKKQEEERNKSELIKLQLLQKQKELEEEEKRRAEEAEKLQKDKQVEDEEEEEEEENEEEERSNVKKWNEEFQELMEIEDDVEEAPMFKFKAIANLTRDFISVAQVYGKIIISERFLPYKDKTIKPKSLSTPNFYTTQGIDFEFFMDEVIEVTEEGDEIWRYGGTNQPNHTAAMRVAKNSVRNYNVIVQSQITGLSYPIYTIVYYRGFCVTAMSSLPINGDTTLVFGVNSGNTFVSDDSKACNSAKQLTTLLNLEEFVKNNTTSSSIQIHKSEEDSRYYIVNYQYLMPPESPAASDNNRYMYNFLHPSLIINFPKKLHSMAYVIASETEDDESRSEYDWMNAAVQDATDSLYEKEIPRFAELLTENQWTSKQLITYLHKQGLNSRHLGYIRSLITGNNLNAQRSILTECVAHTIKHEIRQRMGEAQRISRSTSEEPIRRVVYEYLRPVLSYQTPSPSFFEVTVHDGLQSPYQTIYNTPTTMIKSESSSSLSSTELKVVRTKDESRDRSSSHTSKGGGGGGLTVSKSMNSLSAPRGRERATSGTGSGMIPRERTPSNSFLATRKMSTGNESTEPTLTVLELSQYVTVDRSENLISRGDDDYNGNITLEANGEIPVPWRQKSFFMEITIQSAKAYFVFGLCGTGQHNFLKDATAYSITSDGSMFIQGKRFECPFSWKKGDTIGVFYSFRSKQIVFTKNEELKYSVGVSKGALIPKIIIGKNTEIGYNFGPAFVYNIEGLCDRVSLQSPIIHDDSLHFWEKDIKPVLENYYPHCLSDEELQDHISIRNSVHLPTLAKRIEELLGMKFSERLHTYLNTDPTSSFTLSTYDIVEMTGCEPNMELLEFSDGVVSLLEAMSKGYKHQDKEIDTLMNHAYQKLFKVYLRCSIKNPHWLFYLARYYHHKANLEQNQIFNKINIDSEYHSTSNVLAGSATSLSSYLSECSKLYDEALGGFKDSDVSTSSSSSVAAQIYFSKAVLMCETKKIEEAVALFYQVRDIGDNVLIYHLRQFLETLVSISNCDERIKQICQISMILGKACLDPCNAEVCVIVIDVVIASIRYLSMSQMTSSLNDTFDSQFHEYITFILESLDVIMIDDMDAIKEHIIQELLSKEIDHITLTVLLKLSFLRPSFRDMIQSHLLSLIQSASVPLSAKKSQSSIAKPTVLTVVHPSTLLRRVIYDVESLWTEPKVKQLISSLVSKDVVETRFFNHWRTLRVISDEQTDLSLSSSASSISTSPPALYGSTTTVVGDKIYLFGGHDGKDLRINDVWEYDIPLNKWRMLVLKDTKNVPSPRQDHSADLIDDHQILVWGGRGNEDYLDDGYLFNTKNSSWKKVNFTGLVPTPRSGFSTCRVGDKLYFLGGKVSGGTPGFTVVYILDLGTMNFEKQKTWGQVPLPDYHFTTCCPTGEVIYKFGGEVGGNDLYALHTESFRWYFINTGGEYPSYDVTQDWLSFATIKNKLVMFGGAQDVYCLHLGMIPSDHRLYQTYFDPMGTELAQGNWKECDPSNYPTEERSFYGGCLVPGDRSEKIYTYGGKDNYGLALEDLYIYEIDTNIWSKVEQQDSSNTNNSPPPPELYGHTMSYWPAKNKIFLFGGLNHQQKENRIDNNSNNSNIDGGGGGGGAHYSNKLYELDLDTNTWHIISPTKITEADDNISIFNKREDHDDESTSKNSPDSCLTPRAFHCAFIYNDKLVLWGGCSPSPSHKEGKEKTDLSKSQSNNNKNSTETTINSTSGIEWKHPDEAYVEIIDLETMKWDRFLTIGDIPSHFGNSKSGNSNVIQSRNGDHHNNERIISVNHSQNSVQYHFATCLIGDKLYALGGLQKNGEPRSLNVIHILDLITWRWQTRRIRGDAPEPCYHLNLCAYGKYIIKYGGTSASGQQSAQISILNTQTMVWEAEIDTMIEPMEGHQAFIVGKRMFVIDAGFEVSYLEIDSGDRLGLFKSVQTYGEKHEAKRASVSIWNGTTAFIYGGLSGGDVYPVFSAIDFEIDSFREEEKELTSLPSFVQMNKHLKIIVHQARKIPAREDGE